MPQLWICCDSFGKLTYGFFPSGLSAHCRHVGTPFQQEKIWDKQFQSQKTELKSSVKQSPWISPLKVGVEQCVELLKRGFLQQTSSKPAAPCCLNKVFQGVHYFFLGKCNPYESYLLHGLYFCAKEQPYLYLLPQCLTEMTVTRETGFQDEGQSLPA